MGTVRLDGEAALVAADDARHLADARLRCLADADRGTGRGGVTHIKPASRSSYERCGRIAVPSDEIVGN